METLVKQAEDSIALSVALVSSFMISSFKKCRLTTPLVCPVNKGANTTKAITNSLHYSGHIS